MEVTSPPGTIKRHSLICCRRLCRATTAVTSLTGNNLPNVTLDDNKPTHTTIAESSVPVIAAAIARGMLAGRINNMNARHIQKGGKNYQANNLTFPISPQIPGSSRDMATRHQPGSPPRRSSQRKSGAVSGRMEDTTSRSHDSTGAYERRCSIPIHNGGTPYNLVSGLSVFICWLRPCS